ncbi:thiopeptide-type bacteriocin biosynthesis protein [Nonomuraea sp. NPDC052265]|uniref:thiopeptide-type bacteriocin biosynthesis protein n=1 Tax=Nonomuraea sp. NPDC052265 TaxID=3364374 RepID=UPI0037C67305
MSAVDVARWRALHVFTHHGSEVTDRLVGDLIAPLMGELLAEGAITRWFFIRYWEGGPHIRLRMRDAECSAVERVRGAIERWLATAPAPRELEREAYYQAFSSYEPEGPALGWHEHGEIVECAYEPELARYGGARAIGYAEEFFQASSEIAARIVGGVAEPAKRLGIGLDLLIGFTEVLHPEVGGGVRWQRNYVQMWRHLNSSVAASTVSLREAAEKTIETSGDALRQRASKMRDDARRLLDGGSPARLAESWWAALRGYLDQLAGLRAEGALVGDVDAIAGSHLHMLHNRLGWSPTDEVYLVWMASLLTVGGQPLGDYHADTAEAADRVLHEASKFQRTRFPQQAPVDFPALSLPEERGDALPLPEPAKLTIELSTALTGRRSERLRLQGEIGLGELSSVLFHAAGHAGQIAVEGAAFHIPGRPYPSAGMAYPTLIRFASYAVSGMAPGLYAYRPAEHDLLRVGRVPSRNDLTSSSAYFLGDEPKIDVREAPLVLFLGANLKLIRSRYGLRAYRFALLELGHMAQNILLLLTSVGLRTVPIGGFFDDAACQIACLDGYNEILGYVLPVGR